MKGNIFRGLLIVFLLGIAGGAGFGVEHLQLREVRAALEKELEQGRQLNELIKKKYQEEKARVGHFMRLQAQAEGQIRGLQQEIDRLGERQALATTEKNELERQLEEKSREIDVLTEGLKRAEAEKTELGKLKEALSVALTKSQADQKAVAARLEKEKQELTASAEQTEKRLKRQIDKYFSENRELSNLAAELLKKYENKTVTGSIMQAEPFTQIQKVRMENLIEDYSEKIDRHRIDAEKPQG